MNGTDEWAGPPKATEGKDTLNEASTFGKCSVVDGKACITSDAVPLSGLGLGSEAARPVIGIDLSIPGPSGFDQAKTPLVSSQGSDPSTPGGLDQLDAK